MEGLEKISPEVMKEYLIGMVEGGYEGFSPEEIKVLEGMLEDLKLFASHYK